MQVGCPGRSGKRHSSRCNARSGGKLARRQRKKRKRSSAAGTGSDYSSLAVSGSVSAGGSKVCGPRAVDVASVIRQDEHKEHAAAPPAPAAASPAHRAAASFGTQLLLRAAADCANDRDAMPWECAAADRAAQRRAAEGREVIRELVCWLETPVARRWEALLRAHLIAIDHAELLSEKVRRLNAMFAWDRHSVCDFEDANGGAWACDGTLGQCWR